VTQLLLDFPWDLSAVFTRHDAVKCLLDFDNLGRTTKLTPVPFIENEEYAAFFNPANGHRPAGMGWAAALRFLNKCHRQNVSTCLATPNPQPVNLRDSWRRALREEIEKEKNHNGWRSPQIIVPKVRREDWRPAGNEINIRCEACAEKAAWGPEVRVLVVLEEYESHHFAMSDLDPWDLQRIHPPNPDKPRQHPCILPKLPRLRNLPVKSLHDKLIEAREEGCRVNERYYFIPPDGWQPENVDKDQWREGRAFTRKYSEERDQMGYCDYEEALWVWDATERHWDVQKDGNNYVRVSHTGELL
jgi:hypothetical protein